MPKRFELKYTDEKGQEVEPIVIHRASIGAIERTMAFLIEKYRGNFPTWLSPVQIKVLPITDRNLTYSKKILESLKENNIRAELDDRSETLGAKIRDSQNERVPYMFVVGDKEEKAKTVAVRKRDGKDLGAKDLSSFIKALKKEIEEKIIS